MTKLVSNARFEEDGNVSDVPTFTPRTLFAPPVVGDGVGVTGLRVIDGVNVMVGVGVGDVPTVADGLKLTVGVTLFVGVIVAVGVGVGVTGPVPT